MHFLASEALGLCHCTRSPQSSILFYKSKHSWLKCKYPGISDYLSSLLHTWPHKGASWPHKGASVTTDTENKWKIKLFAGVIWDFINAFAKSLDVKDVTWFFSGSKNQWALYRLIAPPRLRLKLQVAWDSLAAADLSLVVLQHPPRAKKETQQYWKTNQQ